MIISASYRTDIPAFYGEWFINRLNTGYCQVENPYSGAPYLVSLKREDVDGFVFWTKNAGPFMERLVQVHAQGYPFIVQYSINAYPRELEFSVVEAKRSVEHMHILAGKYGPRVPVWRYDPIVLTSLTPVDFHITNFRRLAQALEGVTDEVVISFAQIYQKTRRNMTWAAHEFGFDWHDPDDETKRALAVELAFIASEHGMQLSVCSQKAYVPADGTEAHCIDVKRLSDVAGREIRARLKGNRPECGCFISRDIGGYDTCPHGCVYCYAVQNRALAQTRYHEHDPAGEFLNRQHLTIIEEERT